MAERTFTEEQKSAIETRGKTLLVSAAAGSGKTATLTERIIRTLLDEEDPVGICDLLIVTFTNAAVGEMRERIRAALTAAVAKHPENRRLEKQLYLLPAANILTIDAFCNRLLRECAADAGLPPNYRIADPTEGELLARTMIEELIESVYDGNFEDALTPARLSALSDCLTNAKSDGALGETLFFLYRQIESTERGVASLSDAAASYAHFSSVEKTTAGEKILAHARRTLLHYRDAYDARLAALEDEGGEDAEKYVAFFTPERDALDAALRCKTYAALKDALASFPFGKRIPAVPKDHKTDAHVFAKATRDALKKDLPALSQKFFSYTPEEWKTLYRDLHEKTATLAAFLSVYDTLFRAEKRRRGIAEYADIERYVADALWQDGKKTPFAEAVAARFRAVYIDEFQDVSPLQAHIFSAVVREDNCFSVGDIKQSIYGFRGADPTVFARAKESYPPLATAEDSDTAAVFMSKNFRSDPGVIDFVNGVFDPAFSLLGESIGYREEDRLTSGKTGDPPYRKTEILLVSLPKTSQKDAEEEEPIDAKEAEAAAVAKKIRYLLDNEKRDDGSPIRPSDIAILFRKMKGNAEVYTKALAKRGIRCEVPEEKNFFYNADVLLVLSLLNVIDNPRRDIHLAGLLCSPLFGFCADDLVAVRKEGEGRSLYDALKSYSKCHEEFTKGVDFLKKLEHFREIAEGCNIDRLLARLYAECGLEALAAKNGGTDNLRLFYEYARRFEASSYQGLYGFLHYINRLIESGANFEKAGVAERPDSVRLVTVHASKGLEYPVCFFAETGGSLSDSDSRKAVLLDPLLGPAFRLCDPEGLVFLNNPVRALAEERHRRLACEENLRVLYVALTRAGERLYVSGRIRAEADDFLEEMRREKECATPYSAEKRKSFLEWILASGAPADLRLFSVTEEEEEQRPTEKTETDEKASHAPAPSGERAEKTPTDEISEEAVGDYLSRFSYRYPEEVLTHIPAKLSVSLLSPAILGEEEEEERLSVGGSGERAEKIRALLREKTGILPRFITGNDQKESAKRGIATHRFLQFCDFEKLAATDAETELSRLLREKYLTGEDGRLIRKNEIALFSSSDLFSRFLSAKKIFREFRFHARLPAKAFTEDPALAAALGDEVLFIQGVMDAVFVDESGALCLVDYKTDRLPKDALHDEEKARAFLAEKHTRQLSYYAAAIRKIFGKAPDFVGIYSLPLGKTLEISVFPISD